MAEANDTTGARRRAPAAKFFPINKLPKELIVSVFVALEDPTWVRYTVPLVCKEWAALYRSKDASPLHEELEVDFKEEVERAEAEAARRGRRSRRRPVVHASSVLSWARAPERAGSVRKLSLHRSENSGTALKDFKSEDLGALVAAVGPSLTDLSIGRHFFKLSKAPLWEALRTSVVPARRLRSLAVEGTRYVDVKSLAQLAGSLEELVLRSRGGGGLRRFPEPFFALKKLRRLVLVGQHRITAIPAEISSLTKLEDLVLSDCRLSSLPKELGELSGLTRLDLSFNWNPEQEIPADEAFPAELGKMKSLRELNLSRCNLRAVPAFVGELESLEVLDLSGNDNLQIGAPLDFLIDGCPRLREVRLYKNRMFWTPESLEHIVPFATKLLAKNPSAKLLFFIENEASL